MRTALITIAAVASGLLLAGCGSPSPAKSSPAQAVATVKPVVSAAVACKEFTGWYLGTGGRAVTLNGIGRLQAAVAAAPSGQLYQDMSTVELDVITATGASGDTGQAEALVTLEAVQAVEQDCQVVNPNS